MPFDSRPHCDAMDPPRPSEAGGSLMALVQALLAPFRAWRMRRGTVAALSALDERTLKDLGIYRCEIHSLVYADVDERLHRNRRDWAG